MMKKLLAALSFSLLVSAAAVAQVNSTPITDPGSGGGDTGGGGSTGGTYTQPNLTYHGGSKVVNAKMTYIFWGWAGPGAPGSGEYTSELIAFRRYGIPNHLGMLAQYNASQSAGLLNSGVPDVFDPVAPPPDITDLNVRQEIQKYFHDQIDPWNIYVVVLPRGVTVTSPNGKRSCNAISGGDFCAYHYNFWDNGTIGSTRARYAVIPYPDCCRPYAFNDAMAAEVSVIHEVRETMTDPNLDAWFDIAQLEADDKCATLTFSEYSSGFTFGYQQEWSNAVHGCVP